MAGRRTRFRRRNESQHLKDSGSFSLHFQLGGYKDSHDARSSLLRRFGIYLWLGGYQSSHNPGSSRHNGVDEEYLSTAWMNGEAAVATARALEKEAQELEAEVNNLTSGPSRRED